MKETCWPSMIRSACKSVFYTQTDLCWLSCAFTNKGLIRRKMSKAEKNQVCFKETTSRVNITESYTELRRLGPVLQMICAHLQIQLLPSTFKPLLKHKHICRLCDASLYRPCSGSLPSIISFNNYIGHGATATTPL